jgi:hypothetical protein
MFFVCPAMKFFVDKNSVKYSVHTNIVPRKKCEGYKKRCQWTGPKARSVARLFWYYFGYYFQYHK